MVQSRIGAPATVGYDAGDEQLGDARTTGNRLGGSGRLLAGGGFGFGLGAWDVRDGRGAVLMVSLGSSGAAFGGPLNSVEAGVDVVEKIGV